MSICILSSVIPNEHSISKLSDLTGIPVRTIRSYIQQGLIPRPNSLGRGATYPDAALDRLFAIKAFREVDGISLEEIRARFLTLSQSEIIEKSDPYRRSLQTAPDGSNTTALDYLTQLRRTMGGEWAGDGVIPGTSRTSTGRGSPTGPGAVETPIDRALTQMASLAGGISTRRVAKADPWIRFPINPDIELHVRGAAVGVDRGKFELLVDYIREALFGNDSR
jgi:DNA-binding transcriptional MerR regulator